MSRNLLSLRTGFRGKVELLLQQLREEGIEMRPFYTARPPREQAKMWRQSRSTEEIHRLIDTYRRDGMHYLAHILDSVGPQYGRYVTNAPPGWSWHQWGEAIDCFPVRDGEAVWDADAPEYKRYLRAASSLGMWAGPIWDRVHVQHRPSSVTEWYSPVAIDEEMEKRWA